MFHCSGERGRLQETRRVHMWSHNKMTALGYVYTLGKFLFPQMLYESECHQRWILRGSDISTHARVWLGPAGVLCQALYIYTEARNLVGKKYNNNNNIGLSKWEQVHTYLLPLHSPTPFRSQCSFEEWQVISRVFRNPPPFGARLPYLMKDETGNSVL